LSPLLTAANASARSMPASIRILVDDRDRMILILEDVGDRGSDAAASHDHDMHDHPSSQRVPTRYAVTLSYASLGLP
jgi:hypothetical protein